MIRLIVTARQEIYDRLSRQARSEGDTPQRAANVISGYEQATGPHIGSVVVDMSLRAADTLIEALHSRPDTSTIPLYAVEARGKLPLELRRLCAAVLESDVS
jgi:hypothetical protein